MVKPKPPNAEHFFDVPTVAKKLQKHPMTIYRWIKAGQLPAHRIGNKKTSPLRIKESDLIKLVSKLSAINEGEAC